MKAYLKLLGAAEMVTARMSHRLADTGVTFTQFGAMELLHRLGPQSQTVLARRLLKTAGNITCVIDNLEKRGLVHRERSAEDRRVYHVHLTEEGMRLVREVFPEHEQKIVEEMSVLSEDEQHQLASMCIRIARTDDDHAYPEGK